MSLRLAPLGAAFALVAVVACSGGAVVPPAPPVVAPGSPLATSAAAASAAASSATPALRSASSARSPDTGNVDAPVTPELTVEPVNASTIRVTLVDPVAKAWQLIVDGTGGHAANRWVLTVETGDVAPVITTTDTVAGVEAQPEEQPALEAGATSGRVCAGSVPVCVRAAGVRLPAGGDGTLSLELTRTDATSALTVAGATAGWPADPFVLGPWTRTEAFPWQG